MKTLFDAISIACSKNITHKYSTSFSLGIKYLAKDLRNPVYSIYGFVRLADEIVDSFEGFQQADMLQKLKKDTFDAIEQKISINPVLNSFQQVVHQYHIENELIISFLDSMEMDLKKQYYTHSLYDKYIYGSAEVVGLMCLKVFCKGSQVQYDELKYPAMKLGAAFQKINFLRDLKVDCEVLGRFYFPDVDFNNFCDQKKKNIELEIENDFIEGYKGIKMLPKESRFGVFLAYVYYRNLLKKIKAVPGDKIMKKRIRIPDTQKFILFLESSLKNNLNLI